MVDERQQREARGADAEKAPGRSDEEQPRFVGLGGRRRKVSPFYTELKGQVDYKDPQTLKHFITERGKIVPRRISKLSAKHQRLVTREIKRARMLGLLPFVAQT